MTALQPTTAVETWAGDATASLSVARSIAHHKHQMFGHSRAGLTRGVCRVQAPAAYEPQACELGGRVDRPSFSRISQLVLLPSPGVWTNRPVQTSLGAGLHSPAARHSAERGGLYSAKARPASQTVRNTLSHQQILNAVADGSHVSSVLSSSLIAWFQPSEAPHGRVPNSARAFHRKEGELPNVCG